MHRGIKIALLTLAVVLVIALFTLGDVARGYNATGGEIFSLALPLWVIDKF